MVKHFENVFTTTAPGDKPRVKAGLGELGITDREIAKKLGVHESTLSLWNRGYATIPPDKHTQLVELLRESHAAALVEAAAKPTSAVALKAARAGLILKALDVAAGDKP